MTDTQNKSRSIIHTTHFLEKPTNTRHTLVGMFVQCLWLCLSAAIPILPPAGDTGVVLMQVVKEKKMPGPCFL